MLRVRPGGAYRDDVSALHAVSMRRIARLRPLAPGTRMAHPGAGLAGVHRSQQCGITSDPADHAGIAAADHADHAGSAVPDGRGSVGSVQTDGAPSESSLAAVREWLSSVERAPESGFTDRARLLGDRPRPARQVLDAAADAARKSSGADRIPVWPKALLQSIITAETLANHFQARAAADLAELAGNYPGLREHLATEIALALGCSEGTASRRLDEADDLTRRLPGTAAARWRGVLSAPKVTALRTETQNIPDDIAIQVEADVLPAAPRHTVPELRAAIREAILCRDPDGATSRHRAAVDGRRMSRWSLPDGMAALQITSSATDIAAIHDCVAAIADLAKTPDDPRTTDQRRTDALLDLCIDVLDSGRFRGIELPRRHRRRPHIQVTMPLDALLGADVPCELRGHGPITADQARTIAADGELRRLVCDPLSGVLLDYGHTTYQPPQHLADHIMARDGTCTAPGCRQPAAHCEIDHTIPFPCGPTNPDNLAILCKHHHRAKDGGGHTVHRDPDGWTTWSTPMGHTITTPPHRQWRPPRPDQRTPQTGTDPSTQAGAGQRAGDGAPAGDSAGTCGTATAPTVGCTDADPGSSPPTAAADPIETDQPPF